MPNTYCSFSDAVKRGKFHSGSRAGSYLYDAKLGTGEPRGCHICGLWHRLHWASLRGKCLLSLQPTLLPPEKLVVISRGETSPLKVNKGVGFQMQVGIGTNFFHCTHTLEAHSTLFLLEEVRWEPPSSPPYTISKKVYFLPFLLIFP